MKSINLYKSTGIFQIFGKRPQIIINPSGIWDRTSQRKIHWNSVEQVDLIEVNGHTHISLLVKEEMNSADSKRVDISLARIKVDKYKLERFISDMMTASNIDRAQKIKNITEPGTEV